MSNLFASDVVTLFNQRIRNRMNNSIQYGDGNIPSAHSRATSHLENVFQGSLSGYTDSVRTNRLGNTPNAEVTRQEILEIASRFSAIRNVSWRLRYRQNSSWNTFASGSGIGHLSTVYRTTLNTPATDGFQGSVNASRSELRDYMNSVYSDLVDHRNSTVTFYQDYCHSSCHNSCHSSGRRRR